MVTTAIYTVLAHTAMPRENAGELRNVCLKTQRNIAMARHKRNPKGNEFEIAVDNGS